MEAFTTRGYGATSMSELRRATGASTGSLYHHFPGKEHLAAALYVEGFADYQQGFRETLEGAKTAREGVREAVRFHLRWVRDNPRLTSFLLTEQGPDVLDAARERLRPLTRTYFASVRSWVKRHVEHGEIRELPADLYYPLWIGPAQELARQRIAGRIRIALDEAAELLADSAWEALRGHRYSSSQS